MDNGWEEWYGDGGNGVGSGGKSEGMIVWIVERRWRWDCGDVVASRWRWKVRSVENGGRENGAVL